MSPLQIRITYAAPVMSGYETVTFGNMMTACDEVHKICTRGILPKVEFIFEDGEIREVPASCMC